MHATELPGGRFYRPASLNQVKQGEGDSVQHELPSPLREGIWAFLRAREEMLMRAPGLNMQSYCDYPKLDELFSDEREEDVCSSHHANDDGWPHRWRDHPRRLDVNEPQGKAHDLLVRWCESLKYDGEVAVPREVVSEIERLLERYAFAANLRVAMRVRQHHLEHQFDFAPTTQHCELHSDLPQDVAQFMALAHNAVIDLLAWLDTDQAVRRANHLLAQSLTDRERDLQARESAVAAREQQLDQIDNLVKTQTPTSKWHACGESDPHGSDYNCARSQLMMGDLTDDEMANAVFLYGNRTPPIEDVISGKARMPIVYLTAAKERIRWLSRQLNKVEANLASHMQASVE